MAGARPDRPGRARRPAPLVGSGLFDPARLLARAEPMGDVLEAYRVSDAREPGWAKVALEPLA